MTLKYKFIFPYSFHFVHIFPKQVICVLQIQPHKTGKPTIRKTFKDLGRGRHSAPFKDVEANLRRFS